MKYYINFEEYPELISLNSALEWIAYRTPPYHYSSINKKEKTIKISSNEGNNKSKEKIEIAMHELYSHIKKGEIGLWGEQQPRVCIKDKKNWKNFKNWNWDWHLSYMTEISGGRVWEVLSEVPNPLEGLKNWTDLVKYQDYFKKTIFTGTFHNEIIDYNLVEWDFWFYTLESPADFLFTPAGMFYSTHIDFEALLRLYPEPESDYTIKANVISDYCVYDDKTELVNKIGRKPFAWDSFHAQIGYIIATKGLPKLQKILVCDMEDWAKSKWGYSPSESAMKEKLKPYYDLIKPKNKK